MFEVDKVQDTICQKKLPGQPLKVSLGLGFSLQIYPSKDEKDWKSSHLVPR